MAGNNLYRICDSSPNDGISIMGSGLCLGYLTAITDIMAAGGQVVGRRACVPPSADENQIIDTVKNYLRSNPSSRHLPALGLASKALAEGFPCN